MKKELTKIALFMMLLGTWCIGVDAASYSSFEETISSFDGYNVSIYERATYYTSGSTRWTFSNKTISPYSNLLSCKITSSSTGTEEETATNARISRTHHGEALDYNYQTHYGKGTLLWHFDKGTNLFL